MDAEFRRAFDDSTPFFQHDVPERRLMVAILEDAVATFRRGLDRTSCAEIQTFREVDRWFRSEESDWPFSFESICSTLRIDPGCVRDGLNLLREAAFVSRRPADGAFVRCEGNASSATGKDSRRRSRSVVDPT